MIHRVAETGEPTLLLLVGSRADMTSSEIGRSLDIQRANMVPFLNRLETAGIIRREPLDGKSHAIVLTQLGLELRQDADRLTRQFEAELLARIPLEHRAHFFPALQSLI
jgi:DNA-binding MarR family transcriptional regulator